MNINTGYLFIYLLDVIQIDKIILLKHLFMDSVLCI